MDVTQRLQGPFEFAEDDVLEHRKKGTRYVVCGMVWDCDTDAPKYQYRALLSGEGGVRFTRSVEAMEDGRFFKVGEL